MLDRPFMSEQIQIEERKDHHLDLAAKGQLTHESAQKWGLEYEPLINGHLGPMKKGLALDRHFLNKKMATPLWVSSMTGGGSKALEINQLLAKNCHKFSLGMGLGSCRPLLVDFKKHFADFNLRPLIGHELPLAANFGLAQVEELLQQKKSQALFEVVEKLSADALIIHINPLQEALQPEGDRFLRPALESIQELVEICPYPLIIKEVGQGMGWRSLRGLMQLPLAAIEFGALGGTNFAKIELMRSKLAQDQYLMPLAKVGHNAAEMVSKAVELMTKLGPKALCKSFIVSGGVSSFVEAHAHMLKLYQGGASNVLYGQAFAFLEKAQLGQKELESFVMAQIKGLDLCGRFLFLPEGACE